jgi:hypothetical protein
MKPKVSLIPKLVPQGSSVRVESIETDFPRDMGRPQFGMYGEAHYSPLPALVRVKVVYLMPMEEAQEFTRQIQVQEFTR